MPAADLTDDERVAVIALLKREIRTLKRALEGLAAMVERIVEPPPEGPRQAPGQAGAS